MKSEYTVVVPTIDSSRWIRHLYTYYRSIGVNPFFCVDRATRDDTVAILRDLGARFEMVAPRYPRVESMIASLADIVDTEWILRLDDDECPSEKLIREIDSTMARASSDIYAISRRWVRFAPVQKWHLMTVPTLTYQASAKWDWAFSKNGEDRQFRLYRKDAVIYKSDIHTPGFEIGEKYDYLSRDAPLFHFDWILRSKQQRLEKVRRYDASLPGSAFKSFYIPEDENAWDHSGVVDERKVVRLAKRLGDVANQ